VRERRVDGGEILLGDRRQRVQVVVAVEDEEWLAWA
jgi:hypothetical protein